MSYSMTPDEIECDQDHDVKEPVTNNADNNATPSFAYSSSSRPQIRTAHYFPFGGRPSASYCSAWTELTSALRWALARKVTTLRGGIIISSPVCGFRPLREALFRTVNTPKLVMLTGSPF